MAKDDFIRLRTTMFGTVNLRLERAGLTWPPPRLLVFKDKGDDLDSGLLREPTADDSQDHIFERIRMSELTDEQMASCDHVARGAEYKYLLRGKAGHG